MTEDEKIQLKEKLVQFDFMLNGFVRQVREIGTSRLWESAICDAYFDLTEEVEKYLELKNADG